MAWDTENAWRPDWHGRWPSHKPGQALVEQNVARPLLRVRNTGTTERLQLARIWRQASAAVAESLAVAGRAPWRPKSLKPLRHSVSYAFSVFPDLRPATAALQRPRDERWSNIRAGPHGAAAAANTTGRAMSAVSHAPLTRRNGSWTGEVRRRNLPAGQAGW